MRSLRLSQGIVMGCMLTVTAMGAYAQPQSLPSHTPSGTPIRQWIDGVADTGQFLPDSAVLAVVAGRPITVGQFCNDYFDVYAPIRPKPDLAGRQEFLNTLIDKIVLSEVVRPMPFTPGFEQRATLRDYRQRVLSNVLFQRAVLDSCTPTEQDVRAFYNSLKEEARIQRIRFASPSTAERVRAELASGRITWRQAVALHSSDKVTDPDGEFGWVNLFSLQEPLASTIAGLKAGGVSAITRTDEGFFLFRRVGSRPFSPPPFDNVSKTLRIRLRNHLISQRSLNLQRVLMAERGMTIDSANVRYAAALYQPHTTTDQKEAGVKAVTINVDLPHFEAADNARVLAKWPGGQYTLGEFNHAMNEINPLSRPAIHEPELLADQVVLMALEPVRAELAEKRGYDKDPMAIEMMAGRTEQYKVEAMIEDSVLARVMVSDAERRAYYKEHPREYTSYPRVTFFAYSTETRSAGDSLAQLLRSGTKPEAILLADSLAGVKRGSIQTRTRNEQVPFARLLFEELRPGQTTVQGPLSDATFVTLQLLEFDGGQLLPYEQVIEFVDNQLRSKKEETMYQEFMQRQRAKVSILRRGELLERVRLVAPEI